MSAVFDYPLVLFAISLLLQWIAAFGGRLARRTKVSDDPARDQVVTVLNASLTLLALLIGFSLAMAVGRYDQRKNFEEAEANAIGTEYLRADLLPAPAAARAHALLVSYAKQRIAYYEERDEGRLSRIDAETTRLQGELWNTVAPVADAQRSPMIALVAAGMNDVINSQGYTQAAWWNRVPSSAWILLLVVAVACNALLGRVESRVSVSTLLVLPLLLSVSIFLVADIDSPRSGVIRVTPRNMLAALGSLPPRPPPPPGGR
jgi:amino acid permease